MSDRPRTHPTPGAPQPDPVLTRDARPLEQGEASGGGLTGETGVLTPQSEPGELLTAERREVESPDHAGQAAIKRHPAATGEGGMGPGASGSHAGPLATQRASGLTGMMAEGGLGGSGTPAAGTQAGSGRSELSTHTGGYGGDQGLSAGDPAYRAESDIPGDEDDDRVR